MVEPQSFEWAEAVASGAGRWPAGGIAAASAMMCSL